MLTISHSTVSEAGPIGGADAASCPESSCHDVEESRSSGVGDFRAGEKTRDDVSFAHEAEERPWMYVHGRLVEKTKRPRLRAVERREPDDL